MHAPCSGVFDTLVNLIKIGLGTGVLALPYAASVAGVVGAAICLIIAGAWNYFAVYIMIECMRQVSERLGADQALAHCSGLTL
jgi:amino acid permease